MKNGGFNVGVAEYVGEYNGLKGFVLINGGQCVGLGRRVEKQGCDTEPI